MTRFTKVQLILFAVVTVIAVSILGIYYLRIPSLLGIGQYTLYAELPRSGGLYATGNVTYRGITIGKVTAVEPTLRGARATMSIDSEYKIPIGSSANVHSVSAVGEQYIDLVPTQADPDQFFSSGQTITDTTVPSEIGPALDSANELLEALPQEKLEGLLDETAQAVGGLGPSLQRLVDSTTAIVNGLDENQEAINDIVDNAGPLLDSQRESGDAIETWAANLNELLTQAAQQDQFLRTGLQRAAPAADAVATVFGDVRETLPQTLANVAIVTDLLKRYNKGTEQLLVAFPQAGAVAQTGTIFENEGLLHFALSINQPPPCLTGYLPASDWRSPADTSMADLPRDIYCKIPKDFQGNVVRGARNIPCADVPGKRAATPMDCRSDEPYVPLGTNPWYGDPNQILTCPAPAGRCDQGVKPGDVMRAPSVNSGRNPLPADQLPVNGTPAPISDPISPPGQGTVRCSGQQPNPCIYTPAPGPPGATAIYSPSSGEVVGPDGVRYDIENSSNTGDDGWKEMLAPAG